MSELKKDTQQAMEVAKFLNVFLTIDQIVAVEKLLAMGVSPINLVNFLRRVDGSTQGSPSNRENAL